MHDGDSTTVDAGTEAGLVEAFLTALVGGDGDSMGELVTEDCVLHQPRWPLEIHGRDAVVAAATKNAGAFVDVDVTVQQLVVDDDRVGAYATASGRNVGPIVAGDREIAPTGRTFEVPQFGLYRFADGRVAEAWVLADALGIVEQLGNLPAGPGKLASIAFRQLRWRLAGRPRRR